MRTAKADYYWKISSSDLLSTTQRKISNFKTFKKGWDSGRGLPFDNRVADFALKLNKKMLLSGFMKTDAFPSPDGGIMLTLYENDECLEFLIHSNLKISFIHEKNDVEIEETDELDFEKVAEKIKTFRKQIWILHESLIQNTISIKSENVLEAQHSPSPVKTMESLLWTPSAYPVAGDRTVSTLDFFTEKSRTHPQFSGSSTPQFSLAQQG